MYGFFNIVVQILIEEATEMHSNPRCASGDLIKICCYVNENNDIR